LPSALEEFDDAADLHIGVLGESCEHLSHPAEQLLLVVVEFGPRPHVVGLVRDVLRHRIQRGQLGPFRHHAASDHPGQHPLPVGLVPVVEHPLVLVDALLRRMVGAGAEPHEPGLGRGRRTLVAQHLDRLVGKVFGQVVALFGGVVRLDEIIVDDVCHWV
jgi:hypothetical protein